MTVEVTVDGVQLEPVAEAADTKLVEEDEVIDDMADAIDAMTLLIWFVVLAL